MEFLLERAKAYKQATDTWPKDERIYIPHPATWFNRESYHDDETEWVREGADQGWKPTVSLDQAKDLLSDDTRDTE